MAIVEGLSKAATLAIRNATVVDGHIDGSGHLILEQYDGTPIDAGLAVGTSTTYQMFTPIGVPVPLLTDTVPSGFVELDGTNVSRTTYATLYAEYGTKFGAGDGSTTFGLPNLKGRTIVGIDSTDTTMDATGETGGAKTVTLTARESGLRSHRHELRLGTGAATDANDPAFRAASVSGPDAGFRTGLAKEPSAGSTLGVNGYNSNAMDAVAALDAHQNMPPFMAARWITRYANVALPPAGSTASITPSANTVALRDSSGRTQATDPLNAADVATKGWVEGSRTGTGTWKITATISVAYGTFVLIPASTAVITPPSGMVTNSGGAITILVDGTYELRAEVYWPNNSGGNRRITVFTKNGASIDGSGNIISGGSNAGVEVSRPISGDISTVLESNQIPCVAGDILRAFVFHDVVSTTLILPVGSPSHYMGETLLSINRVK